MDYNFPVINPDITSIGYLKAVANINDKHDRSAPSDYHWKILKCRMLIFSHSSILACPDGKEVKKVHIIFNKFGSDYDKLTSLFIKFSLSLEWMVYCRDCVDRLRNFNVNSVTSRRNQLEITFLLKIFRNILVAIQDGNIREPTLDIYKMCFQYTMTAKIAPTWNVIGYDYLINNRDFLNTQGPHEGIKYDISINVKHTIIHAKPVKINLGSSNKDFLPGEIIRVLPSLYKATVEQCFDCLPTSELFKSYTDLRRHWKNIHGYRLLEGAEMTYFSVTFWKGHSSFTYPKQCLLRSYPIITPLPKHKEKEVLMRFLNDLKNKMPHITGIPLSISSAGNVEQETLQETQAVSLCTPTQASLEQTHTQAKRR